MSETNKLQLKESSILNVPLQIYEKNFTFIVNGEEFKTSQLISDLLSPKISKMHATDPTIDNYTVNTKHPGNFSNILQLTNFKQVNIPKNEISFVVEILENLETLCIELDDIIELTEDNIFDYLSLHQTGNFHCNLLYKKEVEYISSHFVEFCENKKTELKKLQIPSLLDILSDPHLVLGDEDQLLRFVNEIYEQDKRYSVLYETVHFSNVSKSAINEFISVYDINDMTNSTWSRLCERLGKENESNQQNCRYKTSKVSQLPKKEKSACRGNDSLSFQFEDGSKGIIGYLRQKSKGRIEEEINVTSSSVCSWYRDRIPINVCIDDDAKEFCSEDLPCSSITLRFKNHSVIPTGYTLKAQSGNGLPRSWVIEGSSDKLSWETIDERQDASSLDDLFTIDNSSTNEYKYIRMRLTGPNWIGRHYFCLTSIELYGKLV